MLTLRHEACQPWVRRAGSCLHSCPSRARASPFPFKGGVSSGSRGGLCAMLESPKFVPMARPYASYTPISYIYIYISGFVSYTKGSTPVPTTVHGNNFASLLHVCATSAKPIWAPIQLERLLQVPSHSQYLTLSETCNIVSIDGKEV